MLRQTRNARFATTLNTRSAGEARTPSRTAFIARHASTAASPSGFVPSSIPLSPAFPVYRSYLTACLRCRVGIAFGSRMYASGRARNGPGGRDPAAGRETSHRDLADGSSQTTSSSPTAAKPNDHAQNPSSTQPSSNKDLREGHATPITEPEPSPEPPPAPSHHSWTANYAPLYRRLAQSLPHIHRPTRDDLLNVTTGFWQRLRVRFKWFTIRSFRPFNADDISAFVTLLLLSQTVWIVVGTTTFLGAILAAANSLRLQEDIARAISDYLTTETGITVVFESAIVPKWKDSRLSFRNVYISRRPGDSPTSPAEVASRAAGHLAAVGYDVSAHPAYNNYHDHPGDQEDANTPDGGEDTNYSMFDFTVDSIDVELSVARWLEGKGLVKDAVVKGVRGVLDRRSVHWDPNQTPDPASTRRKAEPGDFQLESLELEDVLITIYQPGPAVPSSLSVTNTNDGHPIPLSTRGARNRHRNGNGNGSHSFPEEDSFRPYTFSIFKASLGPLRKQWLFYDLMSAESIVGQIDNCLYSLHKPQSMGRTNERDLRDTQWARMSRFRIDGVPIDHLQGATTQEGPISWITSGKFDAVLDIKFPRGDEDTELPFNAIIEEIADAIAAQSQSLGIERIPGQRQLKRPPLSPPDKLSTPLPGEEIADEASSGGSGSRKAEPTKTVIVDIDLRFRNLKAAVPIFSNEMGYVRSALIRPIVAFMNANRTLVPIHCRIVKDLEDFDGSWTLWQTGLTDEVSLKIYDAMAYHVSQSNPVFAKRIKTVGVWSLQRTVHAALTGLRSMADPVATQLRELYAEVSEAQAQAALEVEALVPTV